MNQEKPNFQKGPEFVGLSKLLEKQVITPEFEKEFDELCEKRAKWVKSQREKGLPVYRD